MSAAGAVTGACNGVALPRPARIRAARPGNTIPQPLQEARPRLRGSGCRTRVAFHDPAGESHALVADVHPRPGHQLRHRRLALAAEGAAQMSSPEHGGRLLWY